MNLTKRSSLFCLLLLASLSVVAADKPGLAEDEHALNTSSADAHEVHAIMQQYYAGAYREVARQGLALLQSHSDHDELRFAVANSLAWTGSHRAALAQYEILHGTPLEDRARLGAAHVLRWSGRHDKAAHAYRQVLQHDAGNAEANEGLRLAEREILPRTTIRLGHARNSDEATRSWTTLTHEWRNETGNVLYSIAAGYADEARGESSASQRDLSFSIEAPDAPLSPLFEISGQQSPTDRLFGSITVKPVDMPVYLAAARINWGKSAFDLRALNDGLTAEQLGIRTSLHMDWAAIRASYNQYFVSDSNVVRTGQLHITPALQPFPTKMLKVFAGLESREARLSDPRYWTPVEGHYNAYAGLLAEWSSSVWESYAYVQYGVPIAGDSGRNWSTGFSVQYWIADKWVTGFDLWAMHTPRDGGYRSMSSTLRLARIW